MFGYSTLLYICTFCFCAVMLFLFSLLISFLNETWSSLQYHNAWHVLSSLQCRLKLSLSLSQQLMEHSLAAVVFFSLVLVASCKSDCLCVFDVDRTLTGKQDEVLSCKGNEYVSGGMDWAYCGGDFVLHKPPGNIVNSEIVFGLENTSASNPWY